MSHIPQHIKSIHSFNHFFLLLSKLLLLSHPPCGVLSLPGFRGSLTSVVTSTHLSHFSNKFCASATEFLFLCCSYKLTSYLGLQCMSISSLASVVFFPLSASTAALFLLSSLDFFFFLSSFTTCSGSLSTYPGILPIFAMKLCLLQL